MSPSRRRGIGLLVVLAAVAGLAVWSVTLQPPAHAAFADGAAELHGRPVTIPVDVQRDGADTEVLVPVMIKGRGPFRFLLDTGASTSAVSGRLVRALALPDTGERAQFSTASQNETDSLFTVPAWSVAGIRLELGATVSDLRNAGDVDGLLGSDQLARFGAVEIDYAHHRLTFTPKG